MANLKTEVTKKQNTPIFSKTNISYPLCVSVGNNCLFCNKNVSVINLYSRETLFGNQHDLVGFETGKNRKI